MAMRSTAPAPAFHLEPYAYAEARVLMDALELAEPVAVTLVRRGYRTVEEARDFLEAAEWHDPFEFEGMAGVVERLLAAVAAGRRITVHGDYDVDGVCATAILVRALRELGADCDWYIPDRLGDGYGLSVDGVRRLAQRGTAVLVTVDCGIGSPDEVEAARRAGLEPIVTDHHEPGERLPDCPILHPVLSGYPCEDLCATGVAHKLAAALAGPERAAADLDLVALATVADLVPLRGENRAMVRRGLAAARLGRRPGLRALMAAASVEPERLDEGDFAFRLAPRINAAGRLYRADAGVELMLTDDAARASAIATELDRANRERRDTEAGVLLAAERARAALDPGVAAAPALVLAGEGWHPGVVGIVASRLAERHLVPVVLIGLGEGGRGRGSGRSIPGFDLLAALRACDRHLIRYGGHRAAAGVEIEAGNVAAFQEAFAAHADSVLSAEDRAPVEAIDAVVGGESLGLEVAEQLGRLAPFGLGNPGVRLLVPAARLRDVRTMGREERHARFLLQSGPRSALGVAFGAGGELEATESDLGDDVSVKLEVNHWNGSVEPRVILGRLYAGPDSPPSPADPEAPDQREWLARLEAELTAPLDRRPSALAGEDGSRQVVDRAGGSGVAAVAALVSTGEPVLVLCADALRRRELIERAAAPARFGGGSVAIASGRLADASGAAAAAVPGSGTGAALADWAALQRRGDLAAGFAHVVLIDPPPFPHLEALAARGSGFLHLAWGEAESELALRVHDSEWPSRDSLAFLYRSMSRAAGGGSLDLGQARKTLTGDGPYPRSPEVAGRGLRVLVEAGVAGWDGSAAQGTLGVVSSEATDLRRSEAFVAYRQRHEEGQRYLTSQRPAS
jgi:single-stranded-DNA-specific exonuclease